MKADIPLDYAVFQLSPRCSRCELFVSTGGNTEKLASGLVKPFVTHLKVAEEQVARAVQSIKLEVGKHDNAETWFTKGTLERFVRFVTTPEILELVNTFDAEMSQLEAARKIYSQGSRDQLSGAIGGDGTGNTAAADATKKELLRAIDVRLVAVRQDLNMAYAHAAAAGFNPETVSELQHFADQFGAHRLNEACTKFSSICQRRPDLISLWKPGVNDQAARASWGSDMSIDDPSEEQSGPHQFSQNKSQNPSGQDKQQQQQQRTIQTQNHLNQSKPSTFQQPKSIFPTQQQQQQGNSEEKNNKEEKKKEEDAITESSTSQPPSRRLSVLDRINLFENKQKESSSGSGGKPVVGKSVDLRRPSSDVSSLFTNALTGPAEKAVLRRGSGASDMSIDLGNERKENNFSDSPLCTPSSLSVSQSKSNVFSHVLEDIKDQKDQEGLIDSASSKKVGFKSDGDRVSDSVWKDPCEGQVRVAGFPEQVGLKRGKNWKDQVGSQLNQLKSFTDRNDQVSVTDREVSEKLKGSLGSGEKSDRFKVQASSQETVGVKDQTALQTQTGNSVSKVGDFTFDSESGNRVDDAELIHPLESQPRFRSSQSHTRSLSRQFEGGIGVKVREARDKMSAADQLALHPQWKSFTEVEEVGTKDLVFGREQIKTEDSGSQRMKFQKQVAAGPEQIENLQGRRDESGLIYGNSKPLLSGKKVSGSQEGFATAPTLPGEQVQRTRQSKGNQELNNELKMKANELEKLFAEHKLRVPGDQSSSTRSKPADTQIEQTVGSHYRKPTVSEISTAQFPDKSTVIEPSGSSSNMENFSTPPLKIPDNQDYGDSLRQNFSELGLSDESRGKFYESYMQKRDAKLREEWSSRRGEKEAKLKAMQDSLERSRAEMKAKFSSSLDRQDSVSTTARRVEKLRSFNFRSTMKTEQHPVTSIRSEEDDDLSEIFEQKYYGQDRSIIENSFGDYGSKSSQGKKLLPNRSISSTTPRTAAAPILRSSGKISNSGSGRRRPQSENPLAQSVPNFSDLRKENTKPYSGISKVTSRSQVRNYARSKSTSEEVALVKEEKPRRSNSLRKSSAGPVEFSDMAPLNSDGVVLAPLKFDKEQSDQSLQEKYLRSSESKPFLRKGNGIGPGAGASIAKRKASMAAEALRNEEEYVEAFEAEDSAYMAKEDYEEEEHETIEVEKCIDIDNEKSRLSQGSDKVGNSGSENGDSLRSLSQVDPSSVVELPTSLPSAFHALGSLQDSPGESPVSWNSRMHHPFSYPHETSDVDASVDSPIGSPASWNSYSLSQTEADAARMRKKWGSAQKLFLAPNSSNNQSRKDVTKGFKRLLQFGRKNRGTESLGDWISATTSEGDDDTEDGRDPANRSSEDLRKSRMRFVRGHPSDDGFNEIQALHSSIPAPPANFTLREDHISGSSIKAPRSFFSLSTFRNKGSDSKPP
ncbi:COP1-interacting protein 7-like isoform X2 [Mangifera indica]|uniref:COP1-interacting protein 7-like isoform X2 n=1 Tax=Mangifera indica TaxID=29780 RepID=UPI001CFC24AD|nr:COP1-interacting protein 7-like isoform X2 [Mangifera indica]